MNILRLKQDDIIKRIIKDEILDNLVYNQITGQVAYKPVTTVDSLTLIGNPVHAFVNTTGNLDYRGMISPDGSVNFNVTPTNIEMEVTNPNNTLINYQLADLNLGTGNIITKIGDENQDSSIDFQPGGNVILNIGGVGDLNVQTGGGDAIHDIAGRITLKSGIGDVRSPNLSTATSANILYYNTANGRITYGTVNSVVNGPIDVNITTNTIPINSLTDTLLQSVIEYPKIYEVKAYLSLIDIINLKHFARYYIKELNGYFILDKVTGFNPDKTDSPTTVTLIKL